MSESSPQPFARNAEQQLSFHLADLCCPRRGRRAEDVLRSVPGVTAATVRWREERAELRVDGARTSAREILAALARAGYRVAPVMRAPRAGAHGPLLAVASAALVSAIGLVTLGAIRVPTRGVFGMAIAVAMIAVAAACASLGPRVVALARRGILDRDALAIAGALAAIGLDVRALAAGIAPPSAVAAVGLAAGAALGSGTVAAAAIAAAAIGSRALEEAMRRVAHRDLVERARPDRRAAIDDAASAWLGRAADEGPAYGSWDDAVVRGILTAALGCASFALVTHSYVADAPFGARAITCAIAVLVVVSPSLVLVAAQGARAIALLSARAAGVMVNDPASLSALSSADVICVGADGRIVVSAIGGRRFAIASHEASRDAAPIALGEDGVEALPALVDLSRRLARTLRVNTVLAIAYHAVLVPLAALGYVPPIAAAALSLAVGAIGLGNAARLSRRSALSPAS